VEPTGRITQDILNRIRKQESGGIEQFVRHLGPRLLVFAHYKIGEKLRARIEPEDVLQDLYIAIVENRDGFLDKVDRRGLHRAIYRMVENRIRDLYEHHFLVGKRAAGREVSPAAKGEESRPGLALDQIASPATSISSQVARQDEYRRLTSLLDRLPADSQRLFVMKFVEELANGEIAEELGVSVSTVKRQVGDLVRELQRLRSQGRR
jgi:RNA polymerase sigma-70 factor, ECF subfamily